MNGRQEHTQKIEERVVRRLKNQPQILKDFYYSMGDKTAATKNVYIGYVIEFLAYATKNGIDCTKGESFAAIKTSDINRYMEKEVRYRTVNGKQVENSVSIRCSKLYGISAFFDFLIDEEYIEHNPCDRVKPPRITEEKEIVYMTPEEIKEVKQNIKNGTGRAKKWRTRDSSIVTLGCSTGLRVASISEINLSDIDFTNNSILVREKGNKVRTVYFGDKTRKSIDTWMTDRERILNGVKCDALFVSSRKKRLEPRSIEDVIKKYTKTLDKKITPHKMRSSCATNLYAATGDIYVVQEVLGHKNISNTRKYARMSEERRKQARDVLDRFA